MRNLLPPTTGSTAGPAASTGWSIRGYLGLTAALAIAAAVAAAGTGYLWSAQRAEGRAAEDLDLLAARAATAVAADLGLARDTVAGLAAQRGLPASLALPLATARTCRLGPVGTRVFLGARLDVVRPDGTVTCSSGDAAGRRVHGGSPWLTAALRARGTQVNWRETDRATGGPAVVVTAALPGPSGRAAGVVALVLPTTAAGRALTDALGGPAGTGYTVVDRLLGQVVAASPGAGPGGRERYARDAGVWPGADGVRRLFASQPVEGSTWRVYAGLPTADVLAAARATTVRQSVAGVIGLLLVLAAVGLFYRRVAGPLDAVTEAVVRAGRDPGGPRVAPAGPRELAGLAAGVNAMLDVRAGVEAELEHQAGHDRLTGLPNRERVLERLEEILAGPGRCAVIALGVNRFNLVNDSLGHDGADRVLVELARRLSGELPRDALLSRHDGAEFVVVCPDTDAEAAAGLASRFDTAAGRPLEGQAARIALSLSAGIAVHEGRGRPEELLGEAHTAMHQARSAGGVAVFDPAYRAGATAALETERDLRLAIERGEFVLRYQPLLDVATRGIVGAEALVRWEHPERGLLPPGDFLPVAEQTGQIVALGEFVLHEACRQAAAWRHAGHPLRVSVNVAAEQFRRAGFVSGVATALGMSGLTADALCLEITESALMRTTDERAWDLERLRHLGVHLAIDDFGTGYSSLAYLHELPVDELKIDRSFVSRLDGRGQDAHLVEAIIRMARALTLNVVAEGVETDDQLGRLAGLGCPTVQGYLIARPQEPEQFIDLVEAERQLTVAGPTR